MPKFTIDLTDPALERLQRLVADYNANQGAALTVQDWIVLHLRELAITADLSKAAAALRQQSESDAREALRAAVLAEKRRLLEAV